LDIIFAAPQKLNNYSSLQTSTGVFSALLERQTSADDALTLDDEGQRLGPRRREDFSADGTWDGWDGWDGKNGYL
jgi:hypothetical protein